MGAAKQANQKLIYPYFFILLIWILFSLPYFFRHLVPVPTDYLVSFFPPWNSRFAMPVKNAAMPDVLTQIIPWKMLTIDVWKQGHVPLWNPYSFAGTVHAANYQSAVFSPLNLLFFVLPFIDAWSTMVLLQPLAAAIFMYLFLRSLILNPDASLFGAVSFMFCGFITVWMAYGTLGWAIAWLPLALYAVNRENIKHQISNGLILTFCVAMSFLSGHFQVSIYFLGLTVAYVFFRMVSVRKIYPNFFLFLYIFAGLLIAGPQLALTLAAFNNSVRAGNIIRSEVIPWSYLVTLFAPDFFGNPVTRNDMFGHYAEWASFIGVVPLIFAVLSLTKRVKGVIKFFLFITVLSLFLAYDTPINNLIYILKIPALATSAASRIIVIFSFSLIVLAAYGFDEIDKTWRGKEYQRFYATAAIFLLLMLTVALSLFIFKPLTPEMLQVAKRNIILPFSMTLAGLFMILTGFKFLKRHRGEIIILLLLMNAFDMYRYASKWMPFEPREFFYPEVKSLAYLSKIAGYDRVFGNIGGEVGVPYQILLTEGYDAMYQGRYGEFIKAVSDGVISEGDRSVVNMSKNGKFTRQALDLLGVKYIYHRISDGRNVWAFPYWEYPPEEMKSIYKDENYEIIENVHGYPRTFLASSYIKETNQQKIIDQMFADDFNRLETLVLEQKPEINPEEGQGKAEIVSYSPDEVMIKTSSLFAKLLFLSDVYDPEWVVYVDGVSKPLLRADFDFRAVSLGPGSHTVRFVYRPGFIVDSAGLVSPGVILVLILYISQKKIYENRFL